MKQVLQHSELLPVNFSAPPWGTGPESLYRFALRHSGRFDSVGHRSMKTLWLKSRKWKQDELDGKLVEFRITYIDAVAVGIGRFLIRGNGVEKLAADIVVPHPRDSYDNYYHLTDILFDQIEVHPDKSKADFRVVGNFAPATSSESVPA